MANIHRLIVLFFLSFLSFNSFAVETFPANVYYCAGPSIHDTSCAVSGSSRFESLPPALDLLMSLCNQAGYSQCTRHSNKISYIYTGYSINRIPEAVYSCPSNSMVWSSVTVCACTNGFNLKNGQCVDPNYVEPPDTCKEIESTCSSFKNERIPRFDVYYSGSTPGGACSNPPLDGCSKGCYLQFTGISVYYKDNEGRSIASGPASFSGDSCVHSDQVTDPDPEKICKQGEFPGIVNGIKVCIPAIEKETEHQPKTENKPDGSTSETKSTVSCSGDKCTVTETTTTKDSTGAVTGVSGTSTVYSEADFCHKNPASGVCKEEEDGKGPEFGGSCSSGFTCEGGDAIACAIAKKQHEDSCALNEPTEESALYHESKGKDGNVTGDLEGNSTYQFSQIKGNPRFSASSCVQDLNVTVWGTSVEIPISKVCPWLSNLGYVLVAVAWIMAAAIVMRGR